MLDWKYINKVSRLLKKQVLGQLTEKESLWLEEWRKNSIENERLYQMIKDEENLKLEYRRRKMMQSDRSVTEIEQRLRIEQRRHIVRVNRKWVWGSVSAVAAMLALIFYLIPVMQNSKYNIVVGETMPELQDSIVAGTTKAELSLSNGIKVALAKNDRVNVNTIQQAKRKQESIVRTENILTTPRGGEFKITLEDSTEVWLNAESQLCYPDSFIGKERKVKLSGEAFFKVAKDAKRPFYVETGGQIVRVYGTEFNINAYKEDSYVYTTLVSGEVSIQPDNNSNAELHLTPGHQALFDKSKTSIRVRSVNTSTVTSWREGRFVFEEQNLEQIITVLSRWYDFTFEFKDERLKSLEFIGTMPRYSQFDDIVKLLEKSGNNLKININGHHIIVTNN